MEKLHALICYRAKTHTGVIYIVSKDGVRILHLSGKSCTQSRKARDRLAMEQRHLGYCQRNKTIMWLLFSNLQNQTTRQIY